MRLLLLGRKHIAKSEDIIAAMKRIGIEVDFLLLPNFHYAESDQTYTYASLGESPKTLSVPAWRSRILYYLYHGVKILSILRRDFSVRRYDVLFAIDWFEAVILIVYRYFFAPGSRVIFYGYDYYFFSSVFSSRFFINRIDAWVVRHVDEAWVVNDAIRLEREKRGVHARLTKTVPIGITDKGLSWEIGDTRHFLFVGNLKPGHNLPKLVEIFGKLSKTDPRYELTIVGKGNLESTLQKEIQEHGAERAVHLRGFVPEETLRGEISAGTYAAGIALYEKTPEIETVDPGKIKDYLSWHLPVLTTPFNAVSELVRSYGLGMIAENDTLPTLLDFFSWIQTDELRERQSHIARFVGDYSFEALLRKHLFIKPVSDLK